MTKLDKVILHCSDTPDDDNTKISMAEITKWHIERGFDTIGYHYVVNRNGCIETGRPLWQMGAHTFSYNEDSIGICYVGRRWPTEAQMNSLILLFRDLGKEYLIQANQWYGHYEFDDKKTCPGISMILFSLGMQFSKFLIAIISDLCSYSLSDQ